MNKKYAWVFVLVVLLVLTVIFSQGDKGNKNLTFGLIAGTTGDYAAVGESFVKGAELAQEQWNLDNPNQHIDMVKEDDGFNAKKGLAAYKKLTSIDKIDGLVNMTTMTIDSIYSDVIDSGMPVALGFEQSIEAGNDNIVQVVSGAVPAEAKLGEYIKAQGFKNVVVFIDNGSQVFQKFADGFKKGYGLPVQEIKVASDDSDIKTNALKVSVLQPDAIVFIVTPTSGALLVKELQVLGGSKYQYVFDPNIQTGFTDYVKVLGDTNVLNGSIVFTIPSVYRADFSEAFKKKFQAEPSIGSEIGYNAFMLLAKTYDSDKKVWVQNMQKATFVGADGQIIFDENGVRIPDLKIGKIENGKLPN